MANGMEALYVGGSGLRSAQNAINTSANNLANVNTAGYVRQQVLFADKNYNTFAYAAVSTQKVGLGVGIGVSLIIQPTTMRLTRCRVYIRSWRELHSRMY